MFERDTIQERDELIPNSAKEILVPAFKFGAFTGESLMITILNTDPFISTDAEFSRKTKSFFFGLELCFLEMHTTL